MASFAACSSAVAAASSLWQARAKARSASGSEGRSAEARDIPCLYRMGPKTTRTNRESLTCQTSVGRCGAGGAIVRRQSIASISSANCADVRISVPSTIGGQTNLLRSSRLANRHRPLPSQYNPFQIVTTLAAEDEDMAAERISADDLLHLRRQAIEAGAQIDRLASEKDLCSRRQGDHPETRSADRTRRSAFSLTLLSTRTRTPSGRSISITPIRSAKVRPAPRGHTTPAAIGTPGLSPVASATTPS